MKSPLHLFLLALAAAPALVAQQPGAAGEKITYEDHIEWDSVSGVWYQKSINTKLRANGKDLVTKRKTFIPLGR